MKWFLYRIKETILRTYHFISPFKDDRLNLFMLASLVVMVIYLIRLFSLGVFDGKKWISLVERQFQGCVRISSEKGEILDRNFTPLAVSEKVVSIYVRPPEIKDWLLFEKIVRGDNKVISEYAERKKSSPEKLLSLLSPLSSTITLSDLEAAFKKKYIVIRVDRKEKKIPFVWLKKGINCNVSDISKAISLALRIYYTLSGENRFDKRYPDLIGYVTEYKRVYPYAVASEVVGVTNAQGDGLSGLEYILEKKKIIAGNTIVLEGRKDARGKVYLGENAVKFLSKQKGNNVVTTIDGNLQYIFERIIKEYGEKWHPKFINAVLMDIHTGDVLAAASYPFYIYGEKKTKNFLSLLNPRFITEPYEPGSVMKPIVLAAALTEGVINVDSVISCPADYKVGDKVFHNEFHGKDVKIRAWEVIEYSDNVGIVRIAQKLGKERLYKYLKLFGFGNKTGIMLPGESPGFLKDWHKWRDVEFATIAFGHFISTTTLQLAAAYAALVNGGYYVKPRILKEIVDDKWNVIKKFPIKKKRIIPEKVSKTMRRVLTMVVEGGTGTATKMENFYIGGKTGTALVYDPKIKAYNKSKITASFVGAFPMTNPEYVLAVTVDEPKVPKNMLWASKIAVPIFRDLAERVLLYERVAPDRKSYTLLSNGTIISKEINTDFILKNGLADKQK
ncbi:cell division protein FtsI (penicillin-binding protein 3) [Desulfurobacterium pacificum]|uniref:Cell division protein FtsI (Penicillin-binding protein 3) n=1 Tax=Desulfurobacterium pacificum TaxID=240166 RepID=A0ABY1NQ37_9BACT|nr:penicillin-binding protein 2 [Desulfurobacterium pacificum]SMP14247.1 cell division protein FtsI (penicillin-binding protein 3) [Desulfurobacterium pacificum]